MSLFKSISILMFYASGSKFLRFGPATRPTRPKRTKEPIPKPAAQGLNPPKAKEANKFMSLKHNIFELAYRLFVKNIPILRHFFVIVKNFKLNTFILNPQNFNFLFYDLFRVILLAYIKTINTFFL